VIGKFIDGSDDSDGRAEQALARRSSSTRT
jgi:hypothetical protein